MDRNNDIIKQCYTSMNISDDVYDYCENIWQGCKDRFENIDKVSEYNQLKVLQAMRKNRISDAHLTGSNGYGYTDIGRDSLEKVYADVFHTEDALVRSQITCGTHALTVALFGNLRPGDELIYVTGKPYDTLERIIGIDADVECPASLREYGITYKQADLKEDGSFDYDAIKALITDKTRIVAVQRSKGYSVRPTLSVSRVGECIKFIKNLNPEIICMVDNCYGEFVETIE
ncbi:MAG: methionine gamma-lyase family protein, partial [Lachnospiraceae bacterium]|nr:methionine gamma-lyase family protein [Lachnospiraceae bacterium]